MLQSRSSFRKNIREPHKKPKDEITDNCKLAPEWGFPTCNQSWAQSKTDKPPLLLVNNSVNFQQVFNIVKDEQIKVALNWEHSTADRYYK